MTPVLPIGRILECSPPTAELPWPADRSSNGLMGINYSQERRASLSRCLHHLAVWASIRSAGEDRRGGYPLDSLIPRQYALVASCTVGSELVSARLRLTASGTNSSHNEIDTRLTSNQLSKRAI
jgi:hypothetical protein